MNEQPTPQVPQTPTVVDSIDRDKELADTALRSTTNIVVDTPTEQPMNDTLPVNEGTTSTTVTEGVGSTYDSSSVVTPPVETPTIVATPVVEVPATDTTAPVVNVVDNTVPPVNEPATQDANNVPSQPETLDAPVQAFGSEQQPAPFQQTPTQPEGLVAKFLHIFKK